MDESIDQRLRARLRSERERVIGSQAELAGRLGLDKSTVSRWESGQRRLLATELLAICREFALTPDQLLADLVEPPIRQLTAPLAAPARRAVLTVVRAFDDCRERLEAPRGRSA